MSSLRGFEDGVTNSDLATEVESLRAKLHEEANVRKALEYEVEQLRRYIHQMFFRGGAPPPFPPPPPPGPHGMHPHAGPYPPGSHPHAPHPMHHPHLAPPPPPAGLHPHHSGMPQGFQPPPPSSPPKPSFLDDEIIELTKDVLSPRNQDVDENRSVPSPTRRQLVPPPLSPLKSSPRSESPVQFSFEVEKRPTPPVSPLRSPVTSQGPVSPFRRTEPLSPVQKFLSPRAGAPSSPQTNSLPSPRLGSLPSPKAKALPSPRQNAGPISPRKAPIAKDLTFTVATEDTPDPSDLTREDITSMMREAFLARDVEKLQLAVELAQRKGLAFEAKQGRRQLAKLG